MEMLYLQSAPAIVSLDEVQVGASGSRNRPKLLQPTTPGMGVKFYDVAERSGV